MPEYDYVSAYEEGFITKIYKKHLSISGAFQDYRKSGAICFTAFLAAQLADKMPPAQNFRDFTYDIMKSSTGFKNVEDVFEALEDNKTEARTGSHGKKWKAARGEATGKTPDLYGSAMERMAEGLRAVTHDKFFDGHLLFLGPMICQLSYSVPKIVEKFGHTEAKRFEELFRKLHHRSEGHSYQFIDILYALRRQKLFINAVDAGLLKQAIYTIQDDILYLGSGDQSYADKIRKTFAKRPDILEILNTRARKNLPGKKALVNIRNMPKAA